MEWQPIETAPKDGRPFLIFQPAKKVEPMVTLLPGEQPESIIGISSWGPLYGLEVPSNFDDENFSPTHWMQLPEPPK